MPNKPINSSKEAYKKRHHFLTNELIKESSNSPRREIVNKIVTLDAQLVLTRARCEKRSKELVSTISKEMEKNR